MQADSKVPLQGMRMVAHYPKRRSDVRVRPIEGETVVFDRQGGFIHQLNCTASYIWERCDGQSTLEDLTEEVVKAFEVDAKIAADDVAAIVGQLHTLHLLEFYDKMTFQT
jgi:hypothetical protein